MVIFPEPGGFPSGAAGSVLRGCGLPAAALPPIVAAGRPA